MRNRKGEGLRRIERARPRHLPAHREAGIQQLTTARIPEPCINALRGHDLSEEQARQVITAGDKENPGPDASEKMEARERVEQLLEGLDERDRLMLILKEVDGFSIEEIAEVLNLNGNTVKVRLFRARRRVVSRAKKRVD